MTMTTPLSQTTVIQAAKEAFFASMPNHFQRLQWDSEQLARLQTRRLRVLLRVAVDRSAFHAGRLGGIDPDNATIDLLPSLPPMTKAEMMGAYDDVVTDHRITLEGLQRHLDELGDEPVLHLDEFVVLASGGSSGVRGIYANDLKGASEQMAAVVRAGLATVAAMMGWPLPGPIPTAIVAAASCVHATRALSSTFLDGRMNAITFAPATLPFAEIVRRVAAAQPMLLIGYPSLIARLADEQLDGRLSIRPMAVTVTSEHLTADCAARISAGFGVPPTNSYGTSEGLMGTAPPGSPVFDFASDLAVVEFMDASDRPVAPGEAAHHVLVTNLTNTVQPMIRYRIDDVMTESPASPDHGHQRASLEGRTDEQLTLAGTIVHPLTIRSALVAGGGVNEYQVRATGRAVAVDVVTSGSADLRDIEKRLATAIGRAGAPGVKVTVRSVDAIARDPRTGKARRFVTT